MYFRAAEFRKLPEKMQQNPSNHIIPIPRRSGGLLKNLLDITKAKAKVRLKQTPPSKVQRVCGTGFGAGFTFLSSSSVCAFLEMSDNEFARASVKSRARAYRSDGSNANALRMTSSAW